MSGAKYSSMARAERPTPVVWGYPPETYALEGVVSEHSISLRAILNMLAAHVEHHRAILRERYLNP